MNLYPRSNWEGFCKSWVKVLDACADLRLPIAEIAKTLNTRRQRRRFLALFFTRPGLVAPEILEARR
jgi:hypothetical protein